MLKKIYNYFNATEKLIWLFSVLTITVFFILFDKSNYINFITSLIGVTALIFMSKANPFAHVLFIIFSILYAYVSFTYSYYGEVFNFLCLTMVLSVVSLVSWIKNPYKNNSVETKIENTRKKDILIITLLSVIVTIIFYFILKYFGTSNLIISTFSVATNFFAAALAIRRSPYFALAYVINDFILIILWFLATLTDISYISVTVYFCISFINDVYIFISWLRLKKKQSNS